MWFNSKVREKPYQPLTCPTRLPEMVVFSSAGGNTDVAWPSSARVVRCWVKSRNERNPYLMLPALRVGTHERLPQTMRRKAGMTSNHHAPYDLGYTRTTMGVNRRKRNREVEQTRETLSQFGS